MNNGRLFQILYLLLERGELTASWLSEKLEVSKRTIYRDVDALSSAGIPVYASQGRGGGIRLLEGFSLDRSLFSEEDQQNILAGLQSMNAVGAYEDSQVISRVAGLFQKRPVEWVEVDFGSWDASRREKIYFETCKQAILTGCLLSFDYYNSEGVHSRRRTEPAKLYFRGGNWYLYGFCLEKQEWRLFRLSRMEELIQEDCHFQPRPAPKLQDEYGSYGNAEKDMRGIIEMKLRFSEAAAFQVLDFFGPKGAERLQDGSFLVKASFPPGRWVRGFLLSFGSDVSVLEPEWLRRELAEEAEKIKNIYQS